jgi:tRNA A-37 threonylcarbamoyl transferase component Bud32
MGGLYLGGRRFLEEIRITTAAERRGIRVAPIVASVTRPASLGFCRHHYLVLEMQGEDLRVTLEGETGAGGPSRPRLLQAVAKALRALHDAGICHADLNLGNVIVIDSGEGEVEIGFVDLDTSRMVESTGFRERMRNLMRLHRSALKTGLLPTVPERARFLRAYFGEDRTSRHRAWVYFRRAAPLLVLHRLLWKLGIR